MHTWNAFKAWSKRRLSAYPRLYAAARAAKARWAPRVGQGRANRHWDTTVDAVESAQPVGWLDWQFVEDEHIRPQVSGDRGVHYLQHFFDTHLPRLPVARGLSLGCGGGNLERALIAMQTARVIDACDASPESIRLAEQLAAEAGMGERLRYQVRDINRIELPEAAYDFVIAKMSLHHFEALEHVYEQVARSLAPGGLFMFNEFVGPSRFQWTDLQLELMNRMWRSMPERNRKASPVQSIGRPTIREMLAIDPTESVRSAEILPLLSERFEVVEHKPYGGTLLHMLLTHVMSTFDLGDDGQRAFLRSWFLFERTLIERGALPSDFAYVVARPLR